MHALLRKVHSGGKGAIKAADKLQKELLMHAATTRGNTRRKQSTDIYTIELVGTIAEITMHIDYALLSQH
jgi:hypothetical protein